MLICPQCQFENPNTNKFCQSCGTSLTYKVCGECGTNVALSAKHCPNCSAETGTVWWAIVTITGVGEAEGADLAEGELTPYPSPLTPFLDQQQRYQILDPLEPLERIVTQEVQVRVLDCQPFQLSLLEAGADLMMEQAIPARAKTYLTVHSHLGQQVPAIHDAWQQGNRMVILIADRSDWRQLLEVWHEQQTTPLQIMQWFESMAQLWIALEPWHCQQSLLDLSNLRVDDGGKFGLQRLYCEPADQQLTIQNLGQVWQRLFQESQRTKFGSLVELLTDLQDVKIQTTEDLLERLAAISSELKANINYCSDLSEVSNAALVAAANEAEVGVTLNNSASPTLIQMNEPQESLMRSEELPTLVLPMHLVGIEDAGSTDVGRQRHHNEDYFGIATSIDKTEYPSNKTIEARGIYILCDGMGGHAGGEVASALAVKTLQEYFETNWPLHKQIPNEAAIREAVRLANQAIYDLNQQDARSGVGRMGTTLVMVILHNTQIAIAHVGDSRLYSLGRKRGLSQVTLDHEVGQREILRGVDAAIAYARPDAYQLTQALGPRDENFVNPDVQFLELNEDTLLLLVSDGLSDNNLLEQHWQTHLEPLLNSGTNLQRGVGELIELANKYNGHDNITAILIRLKVRPKLEQ